MAQLGCYDFEIVVDESGMGRSPLQATNRLNNIAVKCDGNAVWSYVIEDCDSYPITESDGGSGPITGSVNIPVNMRVAGFFFFLVNATPGTYYCRAYID